MNTTAYYHLEVAGTPLCATHYRTKAYVRCQYRTRYQATKGALQFAKEHPMVGRPRVCKGECPVAL